MCRHAMFRLRSAPTVWHYSAEYRPGLRIKAGQVVHLNARAKTFTLLAAHIFRGAYQNLVLIDQCLSAQTERNVLCVHVFTLQSTALKALP